MGGLNPSQRDVRDNSLLLEIRFSSQVKRMSLLWQSLLLPHSHAALSWMRTRINQIVAMIKDGKVEREKEPGSLVIPPYCHEN